MIKEKDKSEIRERARIRQQKHRMLNSTYDKNRSIHKWLVKNTDKIVSMYKNERPIQKIAEEMGVSFSAIYSLLIKNDVFNKKKRKERSGARLIYLPARKEEKNLKPFAERVSLETQMMMKKNTEWNNKLVKRYDIETKERNDDIMIGKVVEMKEIVLQPKVIKR